MCVCGCGCVWRRDVGGETMGRRPPPPRRFQVGKEYLAFLGGSLLGALPGHPNRLCLHGRPHAMPGALALRFRIGTVRYIQSRYVSFLVPCLVFGLESV